MKTKITLLTIQMLLMFVMSINALNDQSSNRLRMRFLQHISPSINENGIVILGIPAVDSLNIKYKCNDYKLVDDHSSTYLKELITFIFPDSIVNEGVVEEYSTNCIGFYNYIHMELYELADPGDYLISTGLNHEQDVLSRVYSDNDSKRYWLANNAFNYKWTNPNAIPPSTSIWYQNVEWPLLDDFDNYGNANLQANDLNFGTYREFDTQNYLHLGTGFQFHGNVGLWHLTSDYNNSLNAWKYTKGKTKDDQRIIVLMFDVTGFFNHPDFVDQTLSYLPLPAHDTDHTGHSIHGTKCFGALAAKAEENSQNGTFDYYSSVGVAPEVQVVGFRNMSDFASIKHDMTIAGDYGRVKVFSSSVLGLEYNPEVAEMVNDGILPVMARGYSNLLSDYGVYADSPYHIIVGDYLPDYRVKTKFSNTDFNQNSRYKVNISAPGIIWTTGFNPIETIFLPYIGLFNYDDPTLDFGMNTSIAAPQVAGVAALIYAMYPWMTPNQVKIQLLKGAHHLSDIQTQSESFVPGCPAENYGAGAVNAYGSLFLHGEFTRNFTFSNEPNNTALIGTEFQLNNSTLQVMNGNLRIQKDAQVQFCNSSLILGDNVTVILEQGAKIILDATSTITVGNNVTFKSEDGETCAGLVIHGNSGLTVSFTHTTFTYCPVYTFDTTVSINNCTFNHSSLIQENKSLVINNSTFSFSYLNAMVTTIGTSYHVHVTNCDFTDSNHPAISITGYGVRIRDSRILRNQGGIELYHCLLGLIDTNVIAYNIRGIYLYGSNIDITGNNNIVYNTDVVNQDSGFGIHALHYSNWTLTGDNASNPSNVQTIHNNQKEQVLFQGNSAPAHMYYNSIYSVNHDHPYVRLWDTYTGSSRVIDVMNNYWSEDFEPERDLIPDSLFEWLPIWEPGIPRDSLENAALALYDQAIAAENNEDYIVAEALLKEIIAEYSETQTCADAAKELLSLIETYNQNYEALEVYYRTYPELRDNPRICQLADYLANFCDIKMGNYEEAITFFEGIIADPQDLPDSIFAVIDAGYTYLLLAANTEKAAFTGKLAWLKPTSVESFMNNRDNLLHNLFNGKTDDPVVEVPLQFGLGKNFPNPFNPSTTISYTIPKEAKVAIKIYNIKGQLVNTLFSGNQIKGEHKLVWNGENDQHKQAGSGLYLIRIDYMGKSITRKAIMLK